ncbi:Smr/MutS family protein, partial [Klebsiella pneumoniae]|uniref:Smr/MutS family protein n=1 Tax=Klebsiella pneumoniae TaxID=573 RepID=UPI001952FF12
HGLTQETAHRRLLGFLRQAQFDGLRVVIVITGKGAPKHAPPSTTAHGAPMSSPGAACCGAWCRNG